ncbi:MAG: glycosyltransferase family 87 protein [Planctomycetota bacterium]
MSLPGLWLLGCLAPLAWLPSLRQDVGLTLLLLLLAFIPYVLAVHGTFRGMGRWPVLILVGVAGRLLLLLPGEGLSDDIYRYVWEGRVIAAGENPYLHAPDDPALEALRDDSIWPRVTHKEVRAAYPPLAQLSFLIGGWVGSGPIGVRLLMLLADLCVWWALARLLKARRLDPRRSIVWGWSPLVMVEVAAGAHLDVLAVLGTVLALLFLVRERPLLAVGMLGLATLAKPYALVVLPFFLASRPLRIQCAQGGIFLGTLFIGYLPFSLDGAPTAGLLEYARRWEHNAAFFPALKDGIGWATDAVAGWFESAGFPEWARSPLYALAPNLAARALLGLTLATLVFLLWRRRADPGRACAVALGALLLLSPTVHPWYLLWFVPFLSMWFSAPLLLWTATVLLSYHVLPRYDLTGVWEEDRFLRLAEYLPVLLWIAWGAVIGLLRWRAK